MVTPENKRISKFLSFILRHKPDAIGLALDEQGWASIEELIEKANASDQGVTLTRPLVERVVETNEKKRFTLSDDGTRIRAAQGHSVQIDLQLRPVEPPEHLFHGTATRFVDSILREGLKAQQRQYVHLSGDVPTAISVGRRYGKPIVLTINARAMHERGFPFYRAENGVWLTESVPIEFIAPLEGH